MKNIVTIVLLFLLAFPASSANGNTLGWKTYLSYNNTNCVEESADQVFVVAEGAILQRKRIERHGHTIYFLQQTDPFPLDRL